MSVSVGKVSVVGFVRYSQRTEFANVLRDVFEPGYFEYRFEIYKTVLEMGQHHLSNDEHFLMLFPKNAYGSLQTINGENAVNDIDRDRARILSTEEKDRFLKDLNFGNLQLDCLHSFPGKAVTESRFRKAARLLTPPVFSLAAEKLRNRRNLFVFNLFICYLKSV